MIMLYFSVSKFKIWNNANLSNLICTANIHKLEHKSLCCYLLEKSTRWEKKSKNRVIVNYIFVCKNLGCAKYATPSAKPIAFIDHKNIFEHSSDLWLSKNLKKALSHVFLY